HKKLQSVTQRKKKKALCEKSDQCGWGTRAGDACANRGGCGRMVERLGKDRGAGQRQRQVTNERNTVAVDTKSTVLDSGHMSVADRFHYMNRGLLYQQRLCPDPEKGQQ